MAPTPDERARPARLVSTPDEAAVSAPASGATIGRIERVPLRDVWKHEAHNFTTWLQENVDVLNEVLDLSLVNVEREQAAGSFSVDLVAEDEAGRTVIIENQLERSNHDHLGKVITYLVGIEAGAAIWIVSDPRPEHIRAISWLNESSSADFYLLKVEGIQIAGSPPAPLITRIVGPSEEAREVGETRRELSERHHFRKRFWTQLLEGARARTRLHAGISPGTAGYVSTSAGKRGLSYNYTVTQHDSGVELYIDRGRDSEEENLRIFNDLLASRDEIEHRFGEPLDWQPLEGRRACRIQKRIALGGYRDEAKWQEIQDEMIEAMVRLEAAMKRNVAALQI